MSINQLTIGIDLDNTIINYETSIKALCNDHYPTISLAKRSKEELKSAVINLLGTKEWTDCQSLLYGRYIKFAELYSNSAKTIQLLKKNGWDVHIISHKTKSSISSSTIQLREVAEKWLIEKLSPVFQNKHELKSKIHFCNSIEEKISKILNLKCKTFVDDLYIVLSQLPKEINRYWIFQNQSDEKNGITAVKNWEDLYRMVIRSND
jgi:uncharacterized HAD superfamily protein